jgi:serine/threonine-protein kinase CTR1
VVSNANIEANAAAAGQGGVTVMGMAAGPFGSPQKPCATATAAAAASSAAAAAATLTAVAGVAAAAAATAAAAAASADDEATASAAKIELTAIAIAADATAADAAARAATAARAAAAAATRAADGSAAAAAAEMASMDYIDALWTSVSQVKTLKFEKTICIGRGGFSTVLRATWRGSTVAVKVLDPKKINGNVVDAIKNEVTVMTANRHPHIVTVLAASVQLPDASIIMELCSLGSLSDVLATARKAPRRLCWRVRLLMASDAACGLAYLHSSSYQIVHRDFNTQNLLVTEDMRVKIADFGLSRLVRTHGGAGKDGGGGGGGDGGSVGTDERERNAMSDGLRNCLFHAPEVIAAAGTTGGASVQDTRGLTTHSLDPLCRPCVSLRRPRTLDPRASWMILGFVHPWSLVFQSTP